MKVTVNGGPWDDLKNKKVIVVRAAADVNSDLYRRQYYVVLYTVFLALIALKMSDFNNSTLEKIYYYIHKATLGTENNADKLNNPSLFLPLEEDNGENGYDYLDSSTKDSNVDEDVGLGYDLDNSYE